MLTVSLGGDLGGSGGFSALASFLDSRCSRFSSLLLLLFPLLGDLDLECLRLRSLDLDLDRLLRLSRLLDRRLSRDRDRFFSLDLERDFFLSRERDLFLSLDFDRLRSRDFDLLRSLDFDLFRSFLS